MEEDRIDLGPHSFRPFPVFKKKKKKELEHHTEERDNLLILILGGESVLVHGGAGSGKTFWAKEVLDALQEKGKTTAILAPTNAAALNAGGSQGFTFHRYLGMKDGLLPEFTFIPPSLNVFYTKTLF